MPPSQQREDFSPSEIVRLHLHTHLLMGIAEVCGCDTCAWVHTIRALNCEEYSRKLLHGKWKIEKFEILP